MSHKKYFLTPLVFSGLFCLTNLGHWASATAQTGNQPPMVAPAITTPLPAGAVPQPALPSGDNMQLQADVLEREAARIGVGSGETDEKIMESLKEKAEEKKLNQKAFKDALSKTLPLSTNQIETLMEKLNDTQVTAAQLPGSTPKPTVEVATLSLDPSSQLPNINLQSGFVTSLTFLDATGQPWPIIDVAVGGTIDVPDPAAGSHMLRITPLVRYGAGNISVRLKDLATPVTFNLIIGQGKVHYRFDARIPQMGPNAKIPLIDRGLDIVAGDEIMMMVLEGLPPQDMERLEVSGTDGRTSAFRHLDKVYVRTPLQMLSPAWVSHVSSGDGTQVYVLEETPVALLSDNGVLTRIQIQNKAKIDMKNMAKVDDNQEGAGR